MRYEIAVMFFAWLHIFYHEKKETLPKDICLGALRGTRTGNTEAWIENYRGILEYTDKQILLQTKSCQVCFEGSRLSIDYYTNEDMKISGCISQVRYI